MTRFRSLALTAVLAVVAGLLGISPAAAAGTASVSGTIVAPGPQGWDQVAYLDVDLEQYVPVGGYWDGVDYVQLEAGDDEYEFTGLEAGQYRVVVHPVGIEIGELWEEFVGGGYRDTTLSVTLGEGEDRTGATVTLIRGGHVTGSVTGAGGGAPGTDGGEVWVELMHVFRLNGSEVWERVGNAEASGGDFDIDIPFSGEYRMAVSVEDGRYWDDDVVLGDVDQDALPTVDFGLKNSASVTGNVSFDPAELTSAGEDNLVYVVVEVQAAPTYWDTAGMAVQLTEPGPFKVWVPGDDDRPHRVRYYDAYDAFDGVYWDGTTYGTTDPAGATSFVMEPGQGYAGRDVTLGNDEETILNTERPSITGAATVGKTLQADGGSWSVSGASLDYQWMRDGAVIPDATSSTYQIGTDDRGARLSVRVTARSSGYTPGAATSEETDVVDQVVKETLKASGGKGTMTVTATITGADLAAAEIGGKIAVQLSGKTLKTAKVKKGTVTVTVTGQKKGQHTYVVKYLGTDTLKATSKKVTVKVK